MYVYVYYVHVIACVSDCWLSDWLTADSDICVYVYDIMDDTSAMWDNWPIGSKLAHKTAFRLCFSRLILTLKQAPRMHQNAPLPDKKSKKFQTPPLLGREIPIPSAPSAPRFSRLRRSAFPFLFIYDSNTGVANGSTNTVMYHFTRSSNNEESQTVKIGSRGLGLSGQPVHSISVIATFKWSVLFSVFDFDLSPLHAGRRMQFQTWGSERRKYQNRGALGAEGVWCGVCPLSRIFFFNFHLRILMHGGRKIPQNWKQNWRLQQHGLPRQKVRPEFPQPPPPPGSDDCALHDVLKWQFFYLDLE